jgi:hypothetical protein
MHPLGFCGATDAHGWTQIGKKKKYEPQRAQRTQRKDFGN